MNRGWQVVSVLLAAGTLEISVQAGDEKPFHEIWEEEVPVMGHLAVAMDGTVLVFKEERARKRVEAKRSEDGATVPLSPAEAAKVAAAERSSEQEWQAP